MNSLLLLSWCWCTFTFPPGLHRLLFSKACCVTLVSIKCQPNTQLVKKNVSFQMAGHETHCQHKQWGRNLCLGCLIMNKVTFFCPSLCLNIWAVMCVSSCLIMTELFERSFFFLSPNVLPRCIALDSRQHGVPNCTITKLINKFNCQLSCFFDFLCIFHCWGWGGVTVPVSQSQLGKSSCPSGLQPQKELSSSCFYLHQ